LVAALNNQLKEGLQARSPSFTRQKERYIMNEKKTVGQLLQELRASSDDPYGSGPFVAIVDGSAVMQGDCDYFIFNGAYAPLRQKEAVLNNGIITVV
jgi:hypothetical protein